MDEATDNAGKIPVVVAILQKFRVLGRAELYVPLVEKIGSRNSEKTVTNAILLLKSLARVWLDQDQVSCLEQIVSFFSILLFQFEALLVDPL